MMDAVLVSEEELWSQKIEKQSDLLYSLYDDASQATAKKTCVQRDIIKVRHLTETQRDFA